MESEAQLLWNNAHTATIEDYKLNGFEHEFYHTEAIELAIRQAEIEYQEFLKFRS